MTEEPKRSLIDKATTQNVVAMFVAAVVTIGGLYRLITTGNWDVLAFVGGGAFTYLFGKTQK